MEEQIISFETAELAKEKGFPLLENKWGISQFYNEHGNIGQGNEGYLTMDHVKEKELVPAPTQSLLQRWLREEHNIDMSIIPHYEYGALLCYDYIISGEFQPIEGFDDIDYEATLEKVLIEALKLI